MTNFSPISPNARHEGFHSLNGRWGLFIAVGLLFIVLGFVALAMVVTATIASVLTIGVFMVITGLFELVLGFRARSWGRLAFWIGAGLLYVAAGAIAIMQPLMAAQIFTLMLGAGLIATGVVRLFLSSHVPSGPSRAAVILSGVVTTLFGLLIVFSWPGSSLVVLGTLLGVDLVFSGVSWLGLGLALRRRTSPSR